MKMAIDFGEPVIEEGIVLSIRPSDLDDFYASASDSDKGNLFFVMLTSLHHFEGIGDTRRAAHLSFLLAYYLFVALTPPGSLELALRYIEKALSLNPIPEYEEWLGLIKRGN